MIKIIMIDDNIELIKAIKWHFSKNNKIKIENECYEGNRALSLIKETNYDLIVLDLILPNKDGICILKELERLNINKPVILSTSFYNDNIVRKLSNYNIEYIMAKPYEFEDLENVIIKTLVNKKRYNSKKIKEEIITILHELGVPSHIKGYAYIKEAIFMMYENQEYKIMKDIYPKIADEYKSSLYNIESAMRHAIEISFNRANINLIDSLFGHSIDINKSKPTNLEFISTIVEKLRLGTNISV